MMQDAAEKSESTDPVIDREERKMIRMFKKTLKTLSSNAAAIDVARQMLDHKVSAAFLTELSMLLITKVNSSDPQVKACAPKVIELIEEHKGGLIELARSSGDGASAVGLFLVESLRCINFANHESHLVKWMIGLMEEAGLVIVGDKEQCINLATFSNLDYRATGKKVVMQV